MSKKTMSEVSRKWLEAAKILGADPTAEVPCPVCVKANILVEDVKLAGGGGERYLRCPACKSFTVIRLAE